ncbi:hypothetical protein [Streptococcus anginosus]
MKIKDLDDLFDEIASILLVHGVEPFQQICDEIEVVFNKYEVE